MKLCAISFKECWEENGRWYSDGGFPAQMGAIGSLFTEMTLVIVTTAPKPGGIPLPGHARVIPMRRPAGQDLRRKMSVATMLPYYMGVIGKHILLSDVVHVPLPGDLPLIGMVLAMLFRRRLVARYCGSWAPTSQTTTMNRVTKAAMRRFAGNHNVMIVTGAEDQELGGSLRSIFATALTQSELDSLCPDLCRGLSSPVRFVYAGRLSPEKGIHVLLEAFSRFNSETSRPAVLTIIGDGPSRPSLEQLARSLGCGENVVFVGQLARRDLTRHFSNADVCVQPSLSEGYSKAWLDAMAHGLPVIASDVGAARAVIGSGELRGWLAAPGDSQALTSLLAKVVTEPRDWTSLRQACRHYAETRTLERWRDQIANICEQQWGILLRPTVKAEAL